MNALPDVPAVVGLKDISKIIGTNDTVTVDGNRGIVEIIVRKKSDLEGITEEQEPQ